MKHLFLYSVVVELFLAATVQAQDANAYPPPQAPFVAAIPDKAQWSIAPKDETPNVESKKDETKGPRRIRSITCTKTGSIKRDLLSYSDGSSEEAWYVDKALLKPESFDPNNILIFDGGAEDNGMTLTTAGFLGTGWIKEKDYDKVVKFSGQTCYHFQRTGGGFEAWINVETKLPVAARISGMILFYRFGAPPESSLQLPPAYQRAYDAYQRMAAHRKQLEQDLSRR